MKKRSKSELREEFRRLLETQQEALVRAIHRKDRAARLIHYGEICGVVAAMSRLGLVDYEEAEYIKNEAWSICSTGKMGSGNDAEAC